MVKQKILVVGASGMLGNAMFRYLSDRDDLHVIGSVRSQGALKFLPSKLHANIRSNVDVDYPDSLIGLLGEERPEVVINCVGLVKQLAAADDPLAALPINAILPHRLARLCRLSDARLIHVSTDCVFDGRKGRYQESDEPNAKDLYGRSKLMGEVDYPHAITLRTSIIGHELNSTHGLIDWFLSQTGTIRGYSRAIFSGLPTVELARVVADHVLPHPQLHGLYHVSSEPIAKLDLLRLVADLYGRDTQIVPDESVVIDRSLSSNRFRDATGYQPPSWRDLVIRMRDFD